MQHASINIGHDNYPTYQEFYKKSTSEKDDTNEISQEALSRFFMFEQSGFFNWEFFCNELEYE